MEALTASASYVMGSKEKIMKEINETINDYKKRFDKMYELGYDLCWLDREIPIEIKDYIHALISNELLDAKTSRVLDLGCGRGKFLRYLEQEGFDQLIGVDVSGIAGQFAKQYTEQSTIVIADGIKGLPFKAETFSLVTELTVLSSLNPQHWPSILNEIHRVLSKGGFYISEVFTREKGYDPNQPLVTRSVIPRELDQVYGVTENELVNIFGRNFSVKEYRPVNPGPNGSFFVLAQKL